MHESECKAMWMCCIYAHVTLKLFVCKYTYVYLLCIACIIGRSGGHSSEDS